MKITLLPLIIMIISSCTMNSNKVTEEDKELLTTAQSLFKPIPHSIIDVTKNKEKIELGKKLYFEDALSKSGTISCNSCHGLTTFGVDNLPTSPGHDGTLGDRNSPTVYNAALHTMQFWDGRAKDVEEQALGPLLNPVEHGLVDEKDALSKIDTAEYASMFKKAFPKDKDPQTFENIGNAIGAFERTLLTPAPFDDFLNGDITALSYAQRQGLRKFIEVGCTSCHSGVAVGGNSFQKLGLVEEFPTNDLGLYEITQRRRDKYKFKVPGLRNIEKTSPYFHNGSIKNLEEAIHLMAKHQLGKELSKKDIKEIKAFLVSLTAKKLPKIEI